MAYICLALSFSSSCFRPPLTIPIHAQRRLSPTLYRTQCRSTSHIRHQSHISILVESLPTFTHLRDEHIDESQSIDQPTEQQPARDIPKITIDDTDQDRTTKDEFSSSSSTETEMSSSHRSSHHSSSKSKHSSSSSKSKTKKDDWSEITDPEERRRVQNRIAQRKFRDKAKEAKERQERDANDRAHAGHSYHTPDPSEMGPDEELSGLPWGGMSIKHVVSKGKAREEESRRGSRTNEDRGSYDSHTPLYDDRDVYYEGDAPYEDADQAYYDYGSGGSGHGVYPQLVYPRELLLI